MKILTGFLILGVTALAEKVYLVQELTVALFIVAFAVAIIFMPALIFVLCQQVIRGVWFGEEPVLKLSDIESRYL